MSTRADFYVGRGVESIEWLGSIAMDGSPDGFAEKSWANPLEAVSEADYRNRVTAMIANREDATHPDQGWPWPWKDSRRTNYVYTFSNDQVLVMAYNNGWMTVPQAREREALEDPDTYPAFPESEDSIDMTTPSHQFPNMVSQQNVTFGKRSGVTLITGTIED